MSYPAGDSDREHTKGTGTRGRGPRPESPLRLEAHIDLRAVAPTPTPSRRRVTAPPGPPPDDPAVGLRALLDAIGAPLFVVDPHGHVDASNEAADRFTGYGPGELTGRSLQRVIPGWSDDDSGRPPDQHPGAADPLGRLRELRRRTGGTVPVTVSHQTMEIDGAAMQVVTVIDRRETVVLRASLDHSAARFQALVEAGGDLVWILDDAGLAREDSLSWRAFTDTSWEQFRGMAWHGQVHPFDHAEMPKLLRSKSARQAPIELDVRLRGADGEWHLVAVRATAVRDASGAISAWVCRARL